MYLTFTPLFYINGPPHIGHLYNIYIAKMFSRYFSESGKSYITITGTDEHGEKVYHSYLDYIVKNNKKLSLEDYRNIRRDGFNSVFNKLDSCMIYNTHSKMHITYVLSIFKKLKEQGFIYKGKYSGFYNLREEKYIDEQEYDSLTQQEKDNFVIKKEEEGYYLKISEENKKFIIDNMSNIVVSERYVEYCKGLVEKSQDVFISRQAPKSSDESSEHSIYCEEEGVYLYVWFDALLYYIAILRVYNYKIFKPIICIGKDIQSFHVCIFLQMSLYILGYIPFQIVVHGMINVNSVKVSKSYNNSNTLQELHNEYSDLFFSYLLSKDITQDTEVTKESIEQYKNFIVKNVRNCYKRYFSLFQSYKAGILDWYELANNVLEHEDHKKLMEMFNSIYNKESRLNGNFLYNLLVSAADFSNQSITKKELWVHDNSKSTDFFIVGNYIRLMMLIEAILCVPGIEDIFNLLKENITASLSMSTKLLEMNVTDIDKLNLDVFASEKYRKANQEKARQQQNQG